LTNLTRLVVTGAVFFSLTPVANDESLGTLVNLTSLSLNGLNISDVGYLAHLTKLTDVGLAQMPVASIEFVRHMPKLQKVYLTRTLVNDISPLLQLPELKSLVVIYTPVRADTLRELQQRGVEVKS
jgi:internalin A